jgi:hypothetical protein
MDDTTNDTTYSLNEAILHVNLTGKGQVKLSVSHTSYGDETHTIPSTFTGHANGDGIAVSVNGVHWARVTNLAGNFSGVFSLDAALAQAKTMAGTTNTSDVRIKFQQYDNWPVASDGREFDNIQVTAVTSQTVPTVTQTFTAGMPTAAQGWYYYSSNEGRIQVTGGRLRLDDTTGNTTNSLNEAILCVNLTGKTNVTLKLDHWSIYDENTPLPTTFTGHFNGDGIALSTNGIDWVRLTNLTGNLTNMTISLDAALATAKSLAGNTDVSCVRIKFQQYDNWPSVTDGDGREFDNIQIY